MRLELSLQGLKLLYEFTMILVLLKLETFFSNENKNMINAV